MKQKYFNFMVLLSILTMQFALFTSCEIATDFIPSTITYQNEPLFIDDPYNQPVQSYFYGNIVTQDCYTNTSVTLRDCAYTIDGYVFVGWSTSYNVYDIYYNSPFLYTSGQTIFITCDTVFYPVWRPCGAQHGGHNCGQGGTSGSQSSGDGTSSSGAQSGQQSGGTNPLAQTQKVTITFNENPPLGLPDGVSVQGEMPQQIFEKDVSHKLDKCTYTLKGYDFLGWAESARETTPSCDNEAQRQFSSDTTLYAVWKAK